MMRAARLSIRPRDVAALGFAAEAAYPEEACALLEGDAADGLVRVTSVHLATNVATDRRRGFEVDPKLLLQLHRTLRDADTSLIGVWHSHPDGSAAPSATDRARADDPALVWLITAVSERGAGASRAFRVDSAAFAEIALEAGQVA